MDDILRLSESNPMFYEYLSSVCNTREYFK